MGEWSNLTQREKSNIIRFAIKNGVSDINQIRDTFNVYAKDSLANVDYNMAAAKASGFGSNGNGHYPDTFKKSNHPTFSDESIYHSEATPGGRWRGNTYEPSEFVLNQQGGWNQFLRGFYNQEQGTGATPVFNGGVMLPEVTVIPQYKEGGSIHIKHPGRLTALKERTGKTEAELWATGNAHTRKMITFARNARKWKHDEGGYLDTANILGKGGEIYIKPSKRGTFTAAATKHGKSVQEFARQVLANKENYSPAMVRKANFARNSAKWHKHADGGPEFLPNVNIQNKLVWLYKTINGVRSRYKTRPGIVNLQNIQDTIDYNGADTQYIWDSPEHESYSAYYRNPNYRAPVIPSVETKLPPRINVSSINIPTDISSRLRTLVSNTAQKPVFQSSLPNDWIEIKNHSNGAYGATILQSRSKPEYYGIKYWSVPGTINGGQGSYAQEDSVAKGLSIDQLNEALFDYKNRVGNVGFQEYSTGGPLYPFSFQKNPYWKTPVVRYDEGGEIRNWDTTLTGKLINYVENSDNVGWNPVDRTWEHPTKPGYDKNQIGMGVDKNKTPGYWDYIQYRPKTNVPFLTELDERLIRHNAIETANKSANARYKFAQGAVNRPNGTVSPVKDAAVVSAIYNLGAGYVANGLFEDKDFMLKLFDGTDKEGVDRINQEYKKKGRNERIAKTNLFLFQK